ncbi:MAG: single-stranded-DNA-specific exonuclease RecJ [Myxococcota bacterium]|nr:single-stranded-DNA-specific exonuclease RecJ [Myxococcota bacterium]
MPSLSFTDKRWVLRSPDRALVRRLEQGLQLHPLVAQCLASRVTDPEAARLWMRPSLDHLHDPEDLLGMPIALGRIRAAIENRESIRIVTDYDVDGTTSSLILQGALRILGAGDLLSYHIPDRFNEGYGFSVVAAERAARDGVGLIITADIGVRDHAAVEAAKERGVDVIICDHHLPAGEAVPGDAIAVLCPPQQGCPYPNKALAACGVSLKLAQALLEDHPRRSAIIKSMLKVAAIGTVADVVDLATPENRAIVTHGLRGLQNGVHSPGLRALLEVSGVQGEVTAEDLGFRLGPRINAAGRLAEATAVIELFDEKDPDRARGRAQALDRLNTERRRIQADLVERCIAQVDDPAPPFVVIWGTEADGWHRGVVGIVAAKVRDHTNRPTAVVALSGEEARGSIRSTPGVHAVHALDSAADLLLGHGGHPAAAGFSTRVEHLEDLRSRLQTWAASNQSAAPTAPVLDVDAECGIDALRTPDADVLAQGLSDLGPHGKGNPAPKLCVNGVHVSDVRPLGERHIRFRMGDVEAVWWSGRVHSHRLTDGPVNVVGSLGYNTWRGRRSVRFTVEDAAPA